MVRNTAPAPRFWLKALTLNRARHLEGKVRFQILLEVLALPVVHDVVDQRLDFFLVQRRQIDPPHIAIHTDHRWQASREV
jgi:hypothetical protein